MLSQIGRIRRLRLASAGVSIEPFGDCALHTSARTDPLSLLCAFVSLCEINLVGLDPHLGLRQSAATSETELAKRKRGRGSTPESGSRSVDSTVPIWKRPGVWLTGAIAAVALLLTNVSSILTNLRNLPGEWEKTSDQFWEWNSEYDAWKGYWTTASEGAVDIGDLNLSDGGFRLQIDEVTDGVFTGSIETAGICEKAPYFDMLMIEGTIESASHADAKVWDIVGGHRQEFAEISLERLGDSIVVRPENDPLGIFPVSTQIARDPGDFFGEHEQLALCPDKRAQFVQRALESVEQREADAAAVDNATTAKPAER